MLIPLLCIMVCVCFVILVLYYARVFLQDVDFHQKVISEIKPAKFDLIKLNKEFQWLKWLYAQTRNPKLTPPSRIEAMQEFDRLYLYRNDYAFLVRSKDYAPFIGLLLTAMAAGFFYIFELRDLTNESPSKIIERVLPLLIGVAAGALLNLFCSGIMQYINSKFNTYRRVAFDWFDYASRQARATLEEDARDKILAQITIADANISEQITQFLLQAMAKTAKVQLDNEELLQSATAATKAAESASADAARATKALERDINKLCKNLDGNITHLTASLNTSAQQVSQLAIKYQGELQTISNCTLELGNAWLSLQPDIRTIAGSSAELVKVTRTFRESLEPAAETIKSASQQYAQLTNVLQESSHTAHKEIELLRSSMVNNTKSFEMMNDSMQKELIPACRTLVNSVGELEKNTRNLDNQTKLMTTTLDKTSTGFERFDSMSNSFGQAVKNQFLPAVASLVEVPGIVQNFRQAIDVAGQSLNSSSSGIRKAFEDNRNHFVSATTLIEKLQTLINNANSATSGLNESANSFSGIIQNLEETSNKLYKVNTSLGPVPAQLEEFMIGLNDVAILSKNIDDLIKHFGKLDLVVVEATKAYDPLVDLTNVLKEIQKALRKISAEKPGIWEQMLIKLGLNKTR